MPDLWVSVVLLACGFAMGAINNLAGAAGVIGLVGLEDAAGLDPRTANASLRPGAIALGLTGWLGFRSRGATVPTKAWVWGLLAVPGAAAGALLALTLPVWVYRASLLVILLAVLWLQLRGGAPVDVDRPPRDLPRWAGPAAFVLIGAHMGFIQVATGLVAILALTAVHSRDLVRINTVKMPVVLCAAVVATVILAAGGRIAWGPATPLALGCAGGSFLASRWSVDRGHAAVRVVVIVITLAVLVRLVWQMTT